MTPDEIIDKDEVLKMAKQAGLCWQSDGEPMIAVDRLEAFAKLVAADADAKATAREREACAKMFDDRDTGTGFYEPHEPAEMIRARSGATLRGEA